MIVQDIPIFIFSWNPLYIGHTYTSTLPHLSLSYLPTGSCSSFPVKAHVCFLPVSACLEHLPPLLGWQPQLPVKSHLLSVATWLIHKGYWNNRALQRKWQPVQKRFLPPSRSSSLWGFTGGGGGCGWVGEVLPLNAELLILMKMGEKRIGLDYEWSIN